MSEKCFCHVIDANGNILKVKDADAREAIAVHETLIQGLIEGSTESGGNGESTGNGGSVDLSGIESQLSSLGQSITAMQNEIDTLKLKSHDPLYVAGIESQLSSLGQSIETMQSDIDTLKLKSHDPITTTEDFVFTLEDGTTVTKKIFVAVSLS